MSILLGWMQTEIKVYRQFSLSQKCVPDFLKMHTEKSVHQWPCSSSFSEWLWMKVHMEMQECSLLLPCSPCVMQLVMSVWPFTGQAVLLPPQSDQRATSWVPEMKKMNWKLIETGSRWKETRGAELFLCKQLTAKCIEEFFFCLAIHNGSQNAAHSLPYGNFLTLNCS